MEVELAIHEVEWCRHGHPVLVLRERTGERRVALAVTVEDAQDLLRECPLASGRFRACALALALLDATGATLDAVALIVGSDQILRADLRVAGPTGAGTVPAHATDGLALAVQRGLPLLIDATALARVGHIGGSGPGCRDESGPPARRGMQPADPLAPFRPFVESLDFGDGGASGRAGDVADG